MQTGSVRYKTLSPGCQVRIAPIEAGSPQARLLSVERKRRKPSAGLVVDSDDSFEIGARVILDLKFPGQPFTYRSVGTVSWAVANEHGAGHKLGVLVYGMDKLDQNGISVSLAPASPFLPAPPAAPVDMPARGSSDEKPPSPPPAGNPKDDPKAPPAAVPLPRPAQPSQPTFEAQKPPHGRRSFENRGEKTGERAENTGSFSAELVSLCAVDLKIAGWLGATASTAPLHPTQAPAYTLHELRDSLPSHMLEEERPQTRSMRPPRPTSLLPSPVAPFPPAQSTAPPPPAWSLGPPDARAPRDKPAAVADTRAVRTIPNVSAAPSTRRPSKPPGRKSEIPIVELDIDLAVDLELDAEEAMMQAFEQIHELYSCPDTQRAAQFVLDLACRLVRCRGGVCGLVAQDCYEIEVICTSGEIRATEVPARLPMSSSLLGHAVRTGENVYVSNPEQDPLFDPHCDALVPNMENAVSVPVQREDYTVGALELVGSPRLSGFVAAETNVLSYIAMAFAEFLETRQASHEDPLEGPR